MKARLHYIQILLLSIVALSSCVDKDLYDPEYVAKLKSQLPNFEMRGTVSASIDYGTNAAYAAISIYTDDPIIEITKNGVYQRDSIVGDPAFSTILDQNGQYSGEITLPTGASHVYIYSADWSAPKLMESDITNSTLKCSIYNDETRGVSKPKKVVADDQLTEISLSTSYGGVTDIVGGWNKYGYASDPNQLYGTGVYTSSLVTSLQQTLWNGNSSKPENLDNSKYVTTTDVVNTSIATAYQDDNGVIHTVTDAEIYFTYITESGWYSSTVGYYYYPINDVPSSPDEIEKFIIVPNVTVTGNNSNQSGSTGSVSSGQQGMNTNTKIQLLFRDPNTGKLTSKFPGGYTIGYFLIPDAYRNSSATVSWTSSTSRVQNSGNYELQVNATENTITSNCTTCGGDGIIDSSSKNWWPGWFGGGKKETSCPDCDGTGKIVTSTGTYNYTYYYYSSKDNSTINVTNFYDANGNIVSDPDPNNMSQYYYDRTFYSQVSSNVNGIDLTKTWIYSNSEWNSNKTSQFISLTDNNTGEIVYGIEDSNNNSSYDDVLFTISCSPSTAIYNPERPTITESGTIEKNIPTVSHGYYMFEDIWSSGGDYDMNDVIVEYKYTENVKSITNYTKETSTGGGQISTTSTTESYIDNVTINIIPKHCGATYQDGFALQLPEYFSDLAGNIESLTVNGGANLWDNSRYWKDLNSGNSDINGKVININDYKARFTYEFFSDIKTEVEGMGYVMKITFKDKSITESQWKSKKHENATEDEKRLRWNYNPYLKVYDLSLSGFSTNTGNDILEIHLPLYPYTEEGIPTAGGASSGTGSYDWNLWFVAAKDAGVFGSLESATEFYPFAMDVPYSDKFYPSREMLPIDQSYPDFPTYSSTGTSNSSNSWYENRAKDKTQPFTLSRSNWIYYDYDTQNDYDK